jgi:flagellar biosynthetic protein FliR
MELFYFSPEQFKIFLLILIRVSVVLFMFPLFGSSMIPALVKAGLAIVMTLILFPVVQVDSRIFPENIVSAGILMVSELFIGLVLALSLNLFFGAVQLAGQVIGFQMGFAIINVLDPQTGVQVSIIDQIGFQVVLVIFLLLNGHHALISALAESFQIADFGTIALHPGFLARVINLSADMFMLAVKMGAPAIAALLFTSAAFGICAKFLPQMNILIAAFPVKIVVGLFFFGVCLQITAILTESYLNDFPVLLTSLLKWVVGG